MPALDDPTHDLQTPSHVGAAAREADAALRRSAAIRVALAVLYAGIFTAVAVVALWGPLRVKTDVIGYAVYANFNPYNYSRTYYLVVGLFPVLALLIFLALTRVGPRLGLAKPPPRGRLRPVIPETQADSERGAEPITSGGAKRRLVAASRVAFVGAVLGLEVGIVSQHLSLSIALAVVGYLAAAGLASAGLARVTGGATVTERLAAVNALGAALCVVGLVLVSQHTELRILSPPSVRHYSWFPLWLGLPLAALLFGCTLAALRRRGRLGAATIERRALLLIAGPVALLLLIAYLQGDIGQVNLFEEGQLLAETRLVGAGWLPWRDVVLTHGLLVDVFQTGGGFAVFGSSYWGAFAGGALLFQPLYVLATFFLLAYLVGRSWTLLLIGGLVFLGTWLGPADPRFLLWPLALLALVALLKRATPIRAAALALVTVATVALTPEAAAALPAVTAVLIAYEWYWRHEESPLTTSFRRTIWYAGVCLVLIAAFAVYMAARGALGDVIYVTVNLISGHTLDGAIPPHADLGVPAGAFYFIALATPVAVIVAIAYAVVRLRLRRPFLTADWPMAAVAVYALASYSEFLARMDAGHAYLVFIPTTPLIFYIVYRAVTALEDAIRSRLTDGSTRWLPAQPIGLALVLCTVVFFWGPIHDRIKSAPAAYHPAVATPPAFARVGYSRYFDGNAFVDLRNIINAYLQPGDRLLDLTDEPALFYYFMNRDPSTRWYSPNGIVATAELQRDVIRELRRDPPKLVVFDDTDLKMASNADMDGAAAPMVRMYLISRWILARYRPLLVSHGRVIYALPNIPPVSSLHLHLRQQPTSADVPFLGQECRWGYAPNFLDPAADPPSSARSVSVMMRPGPVIHLEAPAGSSWADYRWLELESSRSGFGGGAFALSDRIGFSAPKHVITFDTLGQSSTRYVVPISSCPQWYGYGSRPLVLMWTAPHPIAGVRLIR